jgi:hypothetical protein
MMCRSSLPTHLDHLANQMDLVALVSEGSIRDFADELIRFAEKIREKANELRTGE